MTDKPYLLFISQSTQIIHPKNNNEVIKDGTSEIDKTTNLVKKLKEEIDFIKSENDKKVNTLARVQLKEIEDLKNENIVLKADMENLWIDTQVSFKKVCIENENLKLELTSIYKFHCKYCEYRTATYISLRGHTNRKHEGNKGLEIENIEKQSPAREIVAEGVELDEDSYETHTEDSDEDEDVSCFSCKKIFQTNAELIYHNENICNSWAMEGRVYVEMDGCKSGCFLSKSQKLALISNVNLF